MSPRLLIEEDHKMLASSKQAYLASLGSLFGYSVGKEGNQMLPNSKQALSIQARITRMCPKILTNSKQDFLISQ
jgi:hypothetical protein